MGLSSFLFNKTRAYYYTDRTQGIYMSTLLKSRAEMEAEAKHLYDKMLNRKGSEKVKFEDVLLFYESSLISRGYTIVSGEILDLDMTHKEKE